MKNVITSTIVLSSVLFASVASAGEAFVRNTDIYTSGRRTSEINIKGRTNFEGQTFEASGAFKIEEFDRDSQVSRRNDRFVDVDAGLAGSGSIYVGVESYDGFSSYEGVSTSDIKEDTYTWEVSGGVR